MCKFYNSQICGLSMESYRNGQDICIGCPVETNINIAGQGQQGIVFGKDGNKYFAYKTGEILISLLEKENFQIPDELIKFVLEE